MSTDQNEEQPQKREITGKDLMNLAADKLLFLVEGMLQKVGMACLAGASDTGKSTLLRQLAVLIVIRAFFFLGRKINAEHNSVIYVASEDLESETAYLLKKQAAASSPEELEGLRFIFNTENLLEELDKSLTDKKADAVIIDCFGDLFYGKLNDSTSVRGWLHKYHLLALKHQCLILFLHHTGKRTEELMPSKNNLLGSQAFEAKMRLVMELRTDSKNSDERHLCIVKGNYLPENDKRQSSVLKFDPETLTFSHTDKRASFESLVKKIGDPEDIKKFNQALKLMNDGDKTLDEVGKEVGYAGKSGLSKLLKKGKANGWDVGVTAAVKTSGNEEKIEDNITDSV